MTIADSSKNRIVLVALACVGILWPTPDTKAARPNIVFIVADDVGYGELGSYGGTQIPTPHLDRLTREGLRFTHAYVTAPYCAASRAALLTGRYQTRFGFEFNPVGAPPPSVENGAVHSPLQGTDEYMERFTHIPDIHRRIFAAMLVEPSWGPAGRR